MACAGFFVFQRASTGGQNGPIPFSSVSDSFIYKLGMYRIPYHSGMTQFQPLQFSMPGVAAEGESEISDMLGLAAICAPFPLGGRASGEPGPGAVGLIDGHGQPSG